jgi:hypothetical protein
VDQEQVFVGSVAVVPPIEYRLIRYHLPVAGPILRIERGKVQTFELEVTPLELGSSSYLLTDQLEQRRYLGPKSPSDEYCKPRPDECRQ